MKDIEKFNTIKQLINFYYALLINFSLILWQKLVLNIL